MIPKIIHYCWLSNDPFPDIVRLCMNSWKKVLPEYKIKCWNADNFDINSVQFVREAYENKQWAFAADYIRLHVLYNEGGIYLDSDMYITKPLDIFLDNNAFSSVEYNKKDYPNLVLRGIIDKEGNILRNDISTTGLGIQAGIIGSMKNNVYIADCMKYYEKKTFILSDGSFDNKIVAPHIMAYHAQKYGFKYIDKLQDLEIIKIYPSKIFSGHPSLVTHNSYGIHCCNGSWRNKSFSRKFVDFLQKNITLRLK